MKNNTCNICKNKMLVNIATGQYYCSVCISHINIEKYGQNEQKFTEKQDCGCGKKKKNNSK